MRNSNCKFHPHFNFLSLLNFIIKIIFISIQIFMGAMATSCGGNFILNLKNPMLNLTSPNFPSPYNGGSRCKWNLQADFGYRYRIVFESFHLEPPKYNMDCTFADYLEISDLLQKKKYCGSKTPLLGLYLSEGPIIEITFEANYKHHYHGFHLTVTLEKITCGNIFPDNESQNQSISIPNWINDDSDNVICAWALEPPEEKDVNLTCTKFLLTDSKDCLSEAFIVNIYGDDTMKRNIRYCGKDTFSSFLSQKSKINIIFFSRKLHKKTSFHCNYDFLHVFEEEDEDDVMFKKPSREACGSSVLIPSIKSGRIIGGKKVAVNLPMVALWSSSIFCGGILIDPKYVLTAAHCLYEETTKTFKLSIVGKDQRRFYNVKEIITHHKFKLYEMQNDIALIRFSGINDVTSNDMACLPPDNFNINKAYITVLGWGVTYEQRNARSEQPLYRVSFPVTDLKTCKHYYYENQGVVLNNFVFCAGAPGKDTCQGDSGGPALVLVKNRVTVVGVVSFGENDLCGKVPGVYTQVSSYLNWIWDKMEDD